MNKFLLLTMTLIILMSVLGVAGQSDTVWSKEIGSEVKTVKFSPDGQFIYAAALGRKPMKLSTETGEILKEYEGVMYVDVNERRNLDISKNGKQLYSGDAGNILYIWDAETGKVINTINAGYDEITKPYYKSVSVSDKYIAALVAYLDGESNYIGAIQIWDIITLEKIKSIPVTDGNKIKFSANGKYLAFCKSEKSISLYNSETWEIYTEFQSNSSIIPDISFSPDGSLLASGDRDGFLRIWDVVQKKLLKEFPDNFEVLSVNFIGNDKVIAGCGYWSNRYINIFEIQSETLLGQIRTDIAVDIDISLQKHNCVVANGNELIVLDYLPVFSGINDNINKNKDKSTPNPTGNISNISFNLPVSGNTLVSVTDANARVIDVLHKGFLEQGEHKLQWHSKGVSTGTYYCNITGNGFSKTLKIILEK